MVIEFPTKSINAGEDFDSVLTYLSALSQTLPASELETIKPLLHDLCRIRRESGYADHAETTVYLAC